MGKSEQNKVLVFYVVQLFHMQPFYFSAWRWKWQMVNALCCRQDKVLMMFSLFQLTFLERNIT